MECEAPTACQPGSFRPEAQPQFTPDNRCYGEETWSIPLEQTPLSKGDQRYLERATAHIEHFAKSATAPASERAYSSDFADFAAWCDTLGRTWMPASPETVATYLASLPETGLKASTIRRRKAAIAIVHRWEGIQRPCYGPAFLSSSVAPTLGSRRHWPSRSEMSVT
jgi:hypothetical protein